MKVFVVFGVYDGLPGDVEVFEDGESARRRGLQLARDYRLLEQPWDWQPEYGEWTSEIGSTRFWEHHWYNDQRDVVVAECDVERASIINQRGHSLVRRGG